MSYGHRVGRGRGAWWLEGLVLEWSGCKITDSSASFSKINSFLLLNHLVSPDLSLYRVCNHSWDLCPPGAPSSSLYRRWMEGLSWLLRSVLFSSRE